MLRYVNWPVSLTFIDHAVFRSDQQFVGTDARRWLVNAGLALLLTSICWEQVARGYDKHVPLNFTMSAWRLSASKSDASTKR